ncbi:MAG: pyroglutamyl-peptidase I [Spirochaetaceae bacterium]|nr:pyroglutamyl-peptidase I [Spirochaetaceae bacterium]
MNIFSKIAQAFQKPASAAKKESTLQKVLVTGFTPFGGEAINPSYEAVKLLKDKTESYQLIKLELPVVFGQSVNLLEEAMRLHRPAVVLCVGQAGGRFAITPERVAINLDDAGIADNAGNQPISQPIMATGAAAYFATVPIKVMVQAIKEVGLPAAVSNSAGTFVCNHLMYGLLHKLATMPEFKGMRGGFIHVPYITEQVVDKMNMPSLSLEQIAVGLEAAISACIINEEAITAVGGTTH